MEGYHYQYPPHHPASGPMTAPRHRAGPRFQFRAPGQNLPYQARGPQGYFYDQHPNPQQQGQQQQQQRVAGHGGVGVYYRGKGPPPTAPFSSSSSAGGNGNNIRQQRFYNRPPMPLTPVDLTERCVIPQHKAFEPNCDICERKVAYIICTSCGFLDDSGKTRARRKCRVHPKHITYTDLQECPTCQGDLEEHLQ